MVDSFSLIKAETSLKIMRLVQLEEKQKKLERRLAVESSVKEAMYALDMQNPLQLYDCLIPEIDAYRPTRPCIPPALN